MSNPFVIPLHYSLPVNPAGLALWFAADQIEEADGTLLGSWGDLSFNFSAARQDTPIARPQFKVGMLNGLPVVVFDALNDFLTIPTKNALGFEKQVPLSFFAVFKIAAQNTPPVMILSKRDPIGNLGGWYFLANPNPASFVPVSISYNFRGPATAVTQKTATLPLGVLNAWHAMGFTYDGSVLSAGISLYQDGALITSGISVQDVGATTIQSPFPPTIGTQTGDSDGGCGWSLAEMMMFTRMLSAAEIAAVHSYFQQKWATP